MQDAYCSSDGLSDDRPHGHGPMEHVRIAADQVVGWSGTIEFAKEKTQHCYPTSIT